MSDADRKKDTLERIEKLERKLTKDMLDEVKDMTDAQLRTRIVLCQANLAENDRLRDADDQLAETKQAYDDAAEPYKTAKKQQTALATYCTLLLELKEET